MRGRPTLLVALIVLALLPVAGAQQKCRVEYAGMVSEYPCGSGETPDEGGSSTQASAWDKIGVGLAVVGLVGSAGAGGYTLYRVRTRRRELTSVLTDIETTYARSKSDPEIGITRLASIRADVRARHEKGRIDDAHFLELDKRATEYLAKLRMLEIDRRFASLPPLLLAEVRRLLADGVVSQSEADLIEVRASVYRIGEPARSQLVALARRWAGDDEAPATEEVAA